MNSKDDTMVINNPGTFYTFAPDENKFQYISFLICRNNCGIGQKHSVPAYLLDL